MKRVLPALGLLSCALIADQIFLMHLLSIVQWYHFAFMIISVALLGFGASGTLIGLRRAWFLERAETLVPAFMMLSGIAFAAALPLSQTTPVRFDSYLLFVEGRQVVGLLLTYLVFLVPFLFGALAVGLVFIQNVQAVGKLYAANMIGSGLGGILALVLLWLAPVQKLAAPVSLLTILAGVLVANRRRSLLALAIAGCGLIVLMERLPLSLRPSEYKSISRTLTLPDARITNTCSSPFGLVQVVSSPSLRYAPGLSFAYKGPIPAHDVVFNNGDWFGPIVGLGNDELPAVLHYSTLELPYVIAAPRRVLVLQARTGLFAAQAIRHGAPEVNAVEPHADILRLLATTLAPQSDSLFLHPAARIHALDARSFLLRDTSRYDLIHLPTLDAFGGSSGVYALQEQYLLTTEAFAQMWQRLTPGGLLCISSWIDQPVRNPVRALSTIVEMLSNEHIISPAQHIAAIRNWGMVTFAVKRTPYLPDEIERVLEFCARMQFDPLILPGFKVYERNKHNVLYDQTLFRLVDAVLSNRRAETYETYEFRIAPATDDRPYFSQFLRWRSLPRLHELFGQHALPFLELGSFIVMLTLMQIAVLALLLIIVPLTSRHLQRGSTRGVAFYFGTIGLGFMFVEMVFIQKFVLYLGQPLYAVAAVIGAILVFSGIGSALSSRLAFDIASLRRKALVVAALVVGYGLLTNVLVQHTISLPSAVRFILACVMIAPIALVMGMPFPLGLRALGAHRAHTLPWAWGINGYASVVAAPLATILAIEIGFTGVMIGAAALYAAAAWAASQLQHTISSPTERES